MATYTTNINIEKIEPGTKPYYEKEWSNLDKIDANNPKHNFVATTDPTSTDDSSQGYSAGSVWVNTSTKMVFQCASIDATTGAATWRLVVVTTDDLPEGSTNLYFSGKTQDDLPDGATYKQYNPASVNITGGSILGITNLAVSDGGTGASDVVGAKTNLGFMTDLIDDATPQLGGDLDTNGKHINAINQLNSIDNQSKLLQTEDIFADFIVTGLLPATSSTLTSDISAGKAYISGIRVVKASVSHTYTASKDTYVDISSTGTYTFTEVANGDPAPAVAADSIRLAKVVTDASTVSSVTDLRNTTRSINATGDLTINTDTLYVDVSTGYVGIGTTVPDYKAHIVGTLGVNPGSSVTPVNIGDVVVEATNDTTLTFKLKGSDGTIRTATLTLS